MSQSKEQADFEQIRKRVSMEKLLKFYDFTYTTRRGPEVRGPCPIHRAEKRTRSFSVNLLTGKYHCFDQSCGAGGKGVIDLAAAIESCNAKEAGLILWERLQLDQGETISPPAQDSPSGSANHQLPAPPDDSPTEEGIYAVLCELLYEVRAIRQLLESRG